MDLLDQIAQSNGAVSPPSNDLLDTVAEQQPGTQLRIKGARPLMFVNPSEATQIPVIPPSTEIISPSESILRNFSPEKLQSALTTSPLNYLPESERAVMTPTKFLEASAIKHPESNFLQASAGISKGLGGATDFITSPEGIAMLGTGNISPALRRGIAAAFSTQMASQTPEIAQQLGDEFAKPEDQRDLKKISQLITEGGFNTVFSALSGKEAVQPRWRAKPSTTGEPNATQTGIEPQGAEAELPRVPPRQNIPAHTEEIRQGKGQRTTGGGGSVTSAKVETPQQNVQPGVTEQNIDSLPVSSLAQIKHGDGIRYGLTLGEADVPRIQSKYDEANKQTIKAAAAGDQDAMTANFGKANFYGGALMGATRGEHPISGINYTRFIEDNPELAPKPSGEKPTLQAAIKVGDRILVSNGNSHEHIMHGTSGDLRDEVVMARTNPENEGFVDQNGKWYSRDEAGKVLGLKGKANSEDLPNKKIVKPGTVIKSRFISKQPTPARPTAASPIETQLVGMGGAKRGESAVNVKGNPDVYGIRQSTRESRAEAGKTTAVEAGKGISTPDSLEKGRQIIAQNPAAAETALSNFENDPNHAVSANAIAATRAHGEQLQLIANLAEEKFGTDSDEYRNAWQRMADWDARTKPMQTEWHKAGMAQQGETDIDTGSLTGLRRAYNQDTGQDLTPEQQKTAKVIAKKSRKANDAEADARKAVNDAITRNAIRIAKEETKERIARADTPTYLWSKAKAYIEQGVDDFDDLRNKLATDLGMKVKDVTAELGRSKRVKILADDLWKKQQTARKLREQAKRWIKQTALPGYVRALQTVPKILFGLKVGVYGTVAHGTHAPMVAFQPRFWKAYVIDFGKMYKMVASPAYYEMQVQDLQRRPNYITARRAGLVNDPYQYEDYNSPDTAKYFGNLTGMGNRGYTVLKILRQDMFDQYWNKLPNSSKIEPVAKAFADGVNHATGVVKGRAPRGSNIALFAPRLEASRVAWLAVDPIIAADTFLRWKNATIEQKVFAVMQLKEKAWVLGTYFSMLALNQGFLSATGSKQKINGIPEFMGGGGFDPMRSDFMKFKVAGMSFAFGNAMLSMARLPVRLYQIRESSGGKLRSLVFPDESSYSVLGEYGRSQLSPFASLASTLWFKSDWQNRPLPGSDHPVPKRLRASGVAPYTWPEFWSEQVLPIPAEEAAREVWKNGLGMSPEQIKSMRQAMATIAIMAGTGALLTTDVRGNENTQSAKVTQ
jgi:hypothetical protein